MTKSRDEEQPDVDMEVESKAMTASGGDGKKYGEETPVDNIWRSVYHPFPKTHQVLMPYTTSGSFVMNPNGLGGDISGTLLTFRLNSIEDIAIATPARTKNIDWTNDAPDGTRNQPHMFKFWQDKYRYYHVRNTHFKITFFVGPENLNSAELDRKHQFTQFYVYKYMHGLQMPPLTRYGSNMPVKHMNRKFHPDCEWKPLNPSYYMAIGLDVQDVPNGPPEPPAGWTRTYTRDPHPD